ncbi:tetratricopeptide repeat protein [Pseudomonas fluorescens]|uniref:tetratricopeptide repeat protein n=1 Tax=Pseudomonas fluorescens TaxID=294 RepID=UPI001257FDE3|nr:sel1 repeat family protein [Pseudomonas fluorescens]VVO54627.1 hypothetical protein PS898_00469 [Pseudomonas fluorescens]
MRVFSSILAMVLSSYIGISSATPQGNELTKGIILYNQLKFDSAVPELEKEAKSGNVESQYYLGEVLRKRNRYMTLEAQHWYETAAMNDSIYAMIQLSRKNEDLCKIMENCPASGRTPAGWLAYARELTLTRANTGDAESLYLMYEITFDRTWLEKSANAGYALAQYWMAVGDRQGEGFFLMPGSRDASVRKWLLLASEGGNPKAMMEYLEILFEAGEMASVRHWLEVAAATGEQAAMSNYGAYISHAPDKVGYPLDLVKGYAIFSLLKELGDSGGVQDYVERKIEKIAENMTPEQIEESKKVAKDWKDTHPPISFFPEKLAR